MTAYPYRLPRRYRYRPRGKSSGKEALIGLAAFIALVGGASGAKDIAGHRAETVRPAARSAASAAIAFARSRIGCPYTWGGTGPCSSGYDCSGLVMEAYSSAGVRIARTSQDQWATEPHVPASRVQAGDLVFFAGSDGTMTSPGHVGIVIGGGRMIEAYGTGYPVRIASYDRPDLVGFTDPAGLAAVTDAARVPPNEALANSMATSGYGWRGAQITCLDELWTEESGFSAYAANPTSDARGIAQKITGWSAGYRPGNARQQITWGLAYISHTPYGTTTPCGAWAHEKSTSPNWY